MIAALLPLWHQQGHRALLFCQTRQMLDIVQRCVHRAGFRYVRMDGNMAVGSRTRLIDEFNRDASIFIFLLTTKVGGLGVNLTGADRVVIFDPDWVRGSMPWGLGSEGWALTEAWGARGVGLGPAV